MLSSRGTCHCSWGSWGQSPGWLLHLFTLLYLYAGLLQSHTATVSNLSIFPLLLLSEKPFLEKSQEIWFCIQVLKMHPPSLSPPTSLLTSSAYHFININLQSFEYIEIYIQAAPRDLMLSECPFSLMHPLGTRSESEHYQKIGRQPFHKITFKRKTSAKHLSEGKTRTTSGLVSQRSDRLAKNF